MTDPINVRLAEADVQVQVVAGDRASKGDMNLYAETFSAVWSRLPEHDRNQIACYWASKAYGNLPAVILEDPWWGDPDALATAATSGLSLRFNSGFLAQVSDRVAEVLDALMAHEVAHVLQWATGKTRLNLTLAGLSGAISHFPLPFKDEGLVELHADETMVRWGFDPYSIDAWQFKYMVFDKKRDRLVPRKRPLIRGAYTKARRGRMFHYYDLNVLHSRLAAQ